jgi:Txe/YoeB family toxin of Txe-Axe toxin-antitoxin module
MVLILAGDTLRSPFKGIGKPEPLNGDLFGCQVSEK